MVIIPQLHCQTSSELMDNWKNLGHLGRCNSFGGLLPVLCLSRQFDWRQIIPVDRQLTRPTMLASWTIRKVVWSAVRLLVLLAVADFGIRHYQCFYVIPICPQKLEQKHTRLVLMTWLPNPSLKFPVILLKSVSLPVLELQFMNPLHISLTCLNPTSLDIYRYFFLTFLWFEFQTPIL